MNDGSQRQGGVVEVAGKEEFDGIIIIIIPFKKGRKSEWGKEKDVS